MLKKILQFQMVIVGLFLFSTSFAENNVFYVGFQNSMKAPYNLYGYVYSNNTHSYVWFSGDPNSNPIKPGEMQTSIPQGFPPGTYTITLNAINTNGLWADVWGATVTASVKNGLLYVDTTINGCKNANTGAASCTHTLVFHYTPSGGKGDLLFQAQ